MRLVDFEEKNQMREQVGKRKFQQFIPQNLPVKEKPDEERVHKRNTLRNKMKSRMSKELRLMDNDKELPMGTRKMKKRSKTDSLHPIDKNPISPKDSNNEGKNKDKNKDKLTPVVKREIETEGGNE